MSSEGKPFAAPATTITMDNSSQIPQTAQNPASEPLNLTAPPYAAQDGNYQYQAAGWNPAVFPPPPPYNETGMQTQPVIVPQIIFKTDLTDSPGLAVCPACNLPCTTTIEHKSGCLTTLLCCLLFFFGCVLGCFLIPCCIKSCKDVNHYCPNCKNLIYKYKRL
ncbi:lipopolysaccharide-induced tumor necrosis factor-alpha factor homolog [Hyla sarda]|uniref:lipopolysaccharide-induced tumor necrosis factor-alpha factor homolog n=1 Tax=Hyla sarda TaxID=327740 RepID=UPI0024C215E0|nr:lipopolysaccharide-induced tumor necrosis factor-alpha factor homolog [Hyla sarda]